MIEADVVFLFQTFDELLNKVIERPIHLPLAQAFLHFFIQQVSIEQCLLDGAAQIVERLLALRHIVKHVVLETALQQVVRERAEQVLHAHFASRVGNVLAIANAFHKNSRWSLVVRRWRLGHSCLGLGQRPTTDDQRLVIRPAATKGRIFALEGLFRRLRLLLSGGEDAFFISPNTFVRVQAFENKFGR